MPYPDNYNHKYDHELTQSERVMALASMLGITASHRHYAELLIDLRNEQCTGPVVFLTPLADVLDLA